MQETYILTVQTEDGKWLCRRKITGDLRDLSSLLSRWSSVLAFQSEGFFGAGILPGSGTGPSASDSSSPTDSSHAETS